MRAERVEAAEGCFAWRNIEKMQVVKTQDAPKALRKLGNIGGCSKWVEIRGQYLVEGVRRSEILLRTIAF